MRGITDTAYRNVLVGGSLVADGVGGGSRRAGAGHPLVCLDVPGAGPFDDRRRQLRPGGVRSHSWRSSQSRTNCLSKTFALRPARPERVGVRDADAYQPGRPQAAHHKQFVRDWLETQPWPKTEPGPALPDDVVDGTRRRYVEAYERITGASFARYLEEDVIAR